MGRIGHVAGSADLGGCRRLARAPARPAAARRDRPGLPQRTSRRYIVSGLFKLRFAAFAFAAGTPTAVEAGLELDAHPGAVALTALVLAGGASWVALMAARDAAEETAVLKARAKYGP